MRVELADLFRICAHVAQLSANCWFVHLHMQFHFAEIGQEYHLLSHKRHA